jgi:hypothetical protein
MRKLLLFALVLALAAGTVVLAEDGGEKKTKWYDKIKFGGDLRLRYEGFQWDENFDDGRRDRFRYRLRVGAKATVTDNLTVGLQLRSGNPDNPISDNQSLDTGFDKNTISIAEAYVAYKPRDWFEITGGKFRPKNLWTATDMQWDDDIVVEGAMQNFRWKPGGLKSLQLNTYQFVMNESGSGVDSYLFGGQIAPVFQLGEKNQLAVGASYESMVNPSQVAELYFEGDLNIDSGYVTNFVTPDSGELISDFQVGNLFAEWKNKSIKSWPIKVTVFYFKNFGAEDTPGVILPVTAEFPVVDPDVPLATGIPSDNDTGLFARVQFGDYKKPGDIAVRVSRYDSEPDAMFFAYAQSDSRRSSNVDGWRADFRIGMPMQGFINITYYNTDWKLGEGTTMHRWQFDYIFKF